MPKNKFWERYNKFFLKKTLVGCFIILLIAVISVLASGIKNLFAAESGLSALFSWSGPGDGTVEAVLQNVSYGPGKTTPLKYHVYFCSKGQSVGAIACSPALSGDKKAKETLLFTNIDTQIPNPGQTKNLTFPNLPKLAEKNCGRFQADLSIPNGPFIGGKIFVVGKDCQESKPQPSPSASPSPSVKPTPTPKPTASPTPSPSASPSPSPSASPSPSISPSPSPTPTPGVNVQPECVSLSGSPTLGGAQLNVAFTGKGRDMDGIIKEMHFNFGDGASDSRSVEGETNKDTEVTLSHVYKNPGIYTASLRVKDNSGQDNEWSNTPESCKVTIKVEGEVMAAETAPTSPPPAKVMPATGGSELVTLAYLASGGLGLWLRQRVKRHFSQGGVIYQYEL